MRHLLVTPLLVLEMLQLTGPDNQVIDVNPSQIVNLRVPRLSEHFAMGAHCVVFTTDGKYLVVMQTCAAIRSQLKAFDGTPDR